MLESMLIFYIYYGEKKVGQYYHFKGVQQARLFEGVYDYPGSAVYLP